jgi:hypothetical protein
MTKSNDELLMLELNQTFCSRKLPAIGTAAEAESYCAKLNLAAFGDATRGWTWRKMTAAERADAEINQDIDDHGAALLQIRLAA